VPEARLAYVWGGAGADDLPDPLRRTGFSGSEALGQALDRSLDAAGVAIGDVDLVDVYSCFPVVPKLAALHLGLDRDAVLSVAGGHSSFGGPLNTYSLHAIATIAERLRAGAASGLVHANGGYLSYQHSILLGARPHPEGYVGRPVPVAVAHRGAPVVLDAATAAQDGPALTVETATVEHGRDGAPQQAFVVGRVATGERVAAATSPDDRAGATELSLANLPPGALTHVGRTVRLSLRNGQPAVTVPAGDAA
jgi:acetyl-CoA C-acetyltransferase